MNSVSTHPVIEELRREGIRLESIREHDINAPDLMLKVLRAAAEETRMSRTQSQQRILERLAERVGVRLEDTGRL
jgi:hypothetical protein